MTLAFQSVYDIYSHYRRPLSVFGVGNSVTDDVFKEYLQNTTGLLVDKPRNTLDTTTTGKSTDGRTCDTLDVVT